jgi:predicted TIM-barrel fold metal-dependent hydrolase
MLDHLDALPLTDHHCHGVVRRDLDRADFATLLTEAGHVTPLGGDRFDSQIGFALRRWCAPVLDLPPHAEPAAYLARRAELGWAEATRRFLAAARLGALYVDTGYVPEPLLSPAELAGLAGASARHVVRLEQIAEQAAADEVTAEGFADEVRTRLAASDAVAAKSIAAYRHGLELSGERPSDAEVARAAGRWLAAGGTRLADETLHRFLIWAAADRGLPIQVHAGHGDADLDLRRADPLLLTPLLRALQSRGVAVLLLHNYPYHRAAGQLAQVFPHVFVDVGLALHNVGQRAGAVLAETLELAPFGKVLYSSDAFGLPELYHLAAVLFRRALAGFLSGGVADGAWTVRDAERVARLLAGENADRVYR